MSPEHRADQRAPWRPADWSRAQHGALALVFLAAAALGLLRIIALLTG